MNDLGSEGESRFGPALIARDQRGLLGNMGLAVSGQVGAFVVGFATMIITARLIGPNGYGRLAMFFMFVTVISRVVVGWPNLGLVRFGREELAHRGSMADTFWARAFLFLGAVAAATFLLMLFQRQIGNYLQIRYAPHVLLLLYIGLNEIILMSRGVFQTVSKFRAYAAVTFSARALKLPVILLAFVILALHVGVAEMIIAHVVSLAVVALWAIAALPWKQLVPLRLKAAAVRKVIGYSWPLMLAGLSMMVVGWVDFVVIKHFYSMTEVGWYAISYQPFNVIQLISIAFLGALFPLFVSLAVEKRHGTLIWYLDDVLPQIAWAVGLACTVAAGAAELAPLVLGAEFSQSVMPCQILMAGVAFSVLGTLQATMAQAVDRVRGLACILITLAVLNVALDLLLVPRIGVPGAGVATTSALAISGLLYFPMLNSVSHIRGSAPSRRYLTLLAFVPPIAFTFVAVAFSSWALRLAACLAVLVIGAAGARMIGVFKRSTLEKIPNVRMPESVRKSLRRFYSIFGREEEDVG